MYHALGWLFDLALKPRMTDSSPPSLTAASPERSIYNRTFWLAYAANTILVLDDGKLSDMGPHSELLARNPVYRHLWTQQMGRPA